ncbi:MAG TPA: glycosyltransferase family 2 protein [Azospirillum sp.]|nr:glycosyltransferase family 2 protein [Azospirillum sp.]
MIVIPMAGLSRRFAEAGFDRPKYMLEAQGRTLFSHAVGSFEAYFDILPFLFVVRDVADTPAFVAEECRRLGVRDARAAVLAHTTRGQAETVALGLRKAGIAPDETVTIFNIDTFRPGFRFPDSFDVAKVDGYLEVFEGEGANWSFVRPAEAGSDRVAETTEKRPISTLCCTGLYHFRHAGAFLSAFEEQAAWPAERLQGGELYVAPLYNTLIAAGADIRFHRIAREAVVFCGVPEEYDAFLKVPA